MVSYDQWIPIPERQFALMLTFLTIALRAYYTATLYLNPDEAMHSSAAISGDFSAYHHPPLSFWLVWLSAFVSEQLWWLRLPSVVAGGVLPALIAVWLRRHVHAVTAWGLAALIAALPNFVLLTIQIRGYAIALAAIVAAMIALDKAFDTLSRRWLVLHFGYLYIAILSEFMIVWAAIGLGCYALMHSSIRSLFRVWAVGQALALSLYAALYVTVVAPIAQSSITESLIKTYLFGAFPVRGQSIAIFAATGVFKQLVYLAGGIPAGTIAFVFAAIGIGLWLLRRDPLACLCVMPFAAVAGAILRVYPFGRSRHTVVIGVICLLAIGVSIDWLARRFPFARWGVPLTLLATGLAFPMADVHNIPTEAWKAARLTRLEHVLRETIPAGATVVVDSETFRLLQFHFVPRSQRSYRRRESGPLSVRQFSMRSVARGQVLEGGGYWLLDAGFSLKDVHPPPGSELAYHDPGVAMLYRIP